MRIKTISYIRKNTTKLLTIIINRRIKNKKFILIFNDVSIINIIKYKNKTSNTIKKLMSLILKTQEYSSSQKRLLIINLPVSKMPNPSRFKNNSNLKIAPELIFLQLHFLF